MKETFRKVELNTKRGSGCEHITYANYKDKHKSHETMK